MFDSTFLECSGFYHLQALWKVHGFKALALAKRVFLDDPQRARKDNRLQRGFLKAVLSDVFQLLRKLNALQEETAPERAVLNSF